MKWEKWADPPCRRCAGDDELILRLVRGAIAYGCEVGMALRGSPAPQHLTDLVRLFLEEEVDS